MLSKRAQVNSENKTSVYNSFKETSLKFDQRGLNQITQAVFSNITRS
jgi:hypothetical protein